MFSALVCGRISGLRFPRDPVLYNLLRVLFRMLCWLAEHPVPPPSMEVLGTKTWPDSFPASPFHFAIYLRHLMTEAKTASPLESAVYSITWFHQLGGEPSPSDHPLVKSTLAGAHELQQLVASKADSMAPLYNVRLVVICLLAFAAFPRFDDLAKLVRSDVRIEDDMLKLFIQASKTDQYRDGAWIVVASSRKATFPVAMMNRYLDRAGLSCDSPLFCQLSKTKSACMTSNLPICAHVQGYISTTRFQICVKELFVQRFDPVTVSYAMLAGLYQFFWHQPDLVIALRTRLFPSPKPRQVSSTSQQEQDIQSRYNEVGWPFYQFWREWDQRQVGHEEALRERERRKTRERKVNSTTKRTKTSKAKKQGIHSSTSFPGPSLLGWVDGSRPSTESK
ncbi:hypothetical protein P5673_019781, partial [Acropora cervicornis]